MRVDRVTAVFWSATGNTRKSVMAMANTLHRFNIRMDITKEDPAPEKCRFKSGDFVIVGAPVYGGRLYEGAARRISMLQGEKTKCLILVSYGNRHYDDALVELRDLMTERGFIVVGAAAVIGQHTYGQIQLGRPNEEDVEQCRAFVASLVEKYKDTEPMESIDVPGNRPYKDGGHGGHFIPETDVVKCKRCGKCVMNCPESALTRDENGLPVTNNKRCISCFACVRECSPGARKVLDPEYISFAKMFTAQLCVRRENEWFS